MRRKVGVAVAVNRKKDEENFAKVGKNMEEIKLSFVNDVLDDFKTKLQDFAMKYKDRINSDPEFRMQFCEMCKSVGVDPLSSSKGFWGHTLGFGNYYFELGVKIVQICGSMRYQNGGIMKSEQLLSEITKNSNFKSVSIDDITKSIEKLQILGNGFRLLNIQGRSYILSVPLELNKDHEEMLDVANENSINFNQLLITQEIMNQSRGWSRERFDISIRLLLTEGIVWLDVYHSKFQTKNLFHYIILRF